MKNRLIQAYKQAPWRIQMQWIGLFLLGLVLIASITGVYLSISAQAASAGRSIQSLEYDIEEINNQISDTRTALAVAKSTEKMKIRAEELGFDLMNPYQATYLVIPGYDPNMDLVLAPPRVNIISESPVVRSSYKTSLWNWLVEKIWDSEPDIPQLEGENLP